MKMLMVNADAEGYGMFGHRKEVPRVTSALRLEMSKRRRRKKRSERGRYVNRLDLKAAMSVSTGREFAGSTPFSSF